MKFGQDNFYSD